MQVNILEAKKRLSQLIKLVQAGDEVVIANRGEPVVRLVRTQARQAEKSTAGFLRWLQMHPMPAHLRRNNAEIQSTINDERSAWE